MPTYGYPLSRLHWLSLFPAVYQMANTCDSGQQSHPSTWYRKIVCVRAFSASKEIITSHSFHIQKKNHFPTFLLLLFHACTHSQTHGTIPPKHQSFRVRNTPGNPKSASVQRQNMLQKEIVSSQNSLCHFLYSTLCKCPACVFRTKATLLTQATFLELIQ